MALSKHQGVMKMVHATSWSTGPGGTAYDGVLFAVVDPSDPDAPNQDPQNKANQVVVGLELWRQLGQPDTITTTIEPGNTLPKTRKRGTAKRGTAKRSTAKRSTAKRAKK